MQKQEFPLETVSWGELIGGVTGHGDFPDDEGRLYLYSAAEADLGLWCAVAATRTHSHLSIRVQEVSASSSLCWFIKQNRKSALAVACADS